MPSPVVTTSLDGNGSLIIDNAAEGVFQVNRAAMIEPSIFDAEQRRVFDKVWVYFGHESEVPSPGDFRTRTLVGRPLILVHGDDGVIRAFINSCPHRGAEVCREPKGNAKAFRCLYHAWTFANTGAVLNIPDKESYGGESSNCNFDLTAVPRVTNYRGFVFICFDKDAVDLETYLGRAKTYLDYVADQGEDGMEVIQGTQLYSARANWKLLVENSIDFYHTVPLHKTYFQYLEDIGADISGGVGGTGYDLGNGHGVVCFKAGWGRPVARWEPAWGEAEKIRIDALRAGLEKRLSSEAAAMVGDTDRNLMLFPNLLINDIMATVIRQVNPVAPDYMEVTQWALAPIGEPAEARRRRLHAFNTFLGPGGFATPDDIEAFEGCQRGFHAWRETNWSDYSRGYFGEETRAEEDKLSSHETQIRSFYRRWGELMAGGENISPLGGAS
ncbi:MAG: Rieske 2Fe-2S domain-containing protein [Rhodospirillales bacterium]|nr:Rieske 2Fe-2S domain-containing protein [Rhodospirillales bacterium]MBT4007229.1 Rieske 2Fe-2S domain-containing protein [Rhodospirillales bacterium]MBT5113562.1 Rieske 2Fe-2S domain-containing protein [Rhodospirillales bacterium]MBT5673860.1 Rieske 2Fe-2S domain-containing protein [Rhodospirillales bacterium]MBT6186518.1 Rieske 2Fe-2S domain-containing protein [Rhodospirillales bacterium]